MMLTQLLKKQAARLLLAHSLRDLNRLLMTGVPLVAGAALFDYLLPFPGPVLYIIDVLLILIILRCALDILRFARHRRMHAARYLDRHGGQGRMAGAAEFLNAPQPISGDPALIQAEIQAAARLASANPAPSPLKAGTLCAAGVWVAALAVTLLLLPSAGRHQATRILCPWRRLPPLSADHILWVWPSDDTPVTAGQSLHVLAHIPRVAATPQLHIQGDTQRMIPMSPSGQSRWQCNIQHITGALSLQIQDGPFKSTVRSIRFVPADPFAAVTVHLNFPAYTHLPSQIAPLDANRLAILEGTRLTVTIRNVHGHTGTLTLMSGQKRLHHGPLKAEGDDLTGVLLVTQGGRLVMTVTQPWAAKREVWLECLPDLPPEVTVPFPPPLLIACRGSTVPVAVQARDHFGLSAVIIQQPDQETTFPQNKKTAAIKHAVTVDNPKTKTTALHISAMDNRLPHGRRTVAERRTIKWVSPETFQQLRQWHAFDRLKKSLVKLRKEAVALRAAAQDLQAESAYTADRSGTLIPLLNRAAGTVDAIRSMPLFKGTDALSAPILQSAQGLLTHHRQTPPDTEAAIRQWVGFVFYYADELLETLDKLLPRAQQAAEAPALLTALKAIMALPGVQAELVGRIKQTPADLQDCHARQTALDEDRQSLAARLTAIAAGQPLKLADFLKRINRRLTDQTLTRAITQTCAALSEGRAAQAAAASEQALAHLRDIASAIASAAEDTGLDALELLQLPGQGDDIGAAMTGSPERFGLWGPGADTLVESEKPDAPILTGTQYFHRPKPPSRQTGRKDLYAPLIRAYENLLARINRSQPRSTRAPHSRTAPPAVQNNPKEDRP